MDQRMISNILGKVLLPLLFTNALSVEVRLGGTGAPGSGRVEVFFNGVWGTVCDDSWDIKDAHVVCRMLGFPKALHAHSNAKYGQGTGLIWLDNVKCNGNETSIAKCPSNPWGEHFCSHSEDAGVKCLVGEASVRLRGSSVPGTGRVEVFHNGQWGTVCDDSWDVNDGHVVCRMLGYTHALQVKHDAKYGEGSGNIWLDEVQCNGAEQNLSFCKHNPWGSHDCVHTEDAGVNCSTTKARLSGTGAPGSGRVEVFHQGVWGTVCDDSWDINDAHVVCRMLGFPEALKATTNAKYGQGTGKIWLDNVQCTGNENSLSLCSHNQWRSHNCKHSEDAGVVCSNKVRLNGTGGLTSGRVEVYHNGVWGTVCNNSWDIQDAHVACRMLGFPKALESKINAKYGPAAAMIWLDKVKCNGDEESLFHCSHSQWGQHNCKHSDVVGIQCLDSAVDVRLVDSTLPYSGRVEVKYDGTWGTVCNDSWDILDADVVCRMLGYIAASHVISLPSKRQRRRKIWIENINCTGEERSLVWCPHTGWSDHHCTHFEDAGVVCSNSTVRLRGPNVQGSGRVEVYYNGTWGTVCDTFWDIKDANVVCRMLGYTHALQTACCGRYGRGKGKIWFDRFACTGAERSIFDCSHSKRNSNICGYLGNVDVTCSNGTGKLVGGQSPLEGRLEIYHNGSWRSVCTEQWTLKDAHVACRMMGYHSALHASTITVNLGNRVSMKDLRCSGSEKSLPACQNNGWKFQDYREKRKCATAICSVAIRLNGGSSTANGRVEMFFNGYWGTVCATNWDVRDAEVVCRMLGYSRALRATSVKRHTGDKTPIWLDRVRCRGLEQNIESCSYSGWGVGKCNRDMDAWVTCNTFQEYELWSTWSEWSFCSASCGNGWQVRSRVCEEGCDQKSYTKYRNCTLPSCREPPKEADSKDIRGDQIPSSYEVMVPLLSVICVLLLLVIIILVYKRKSSKKKGHETVIINSHENEGQRPASQEYNDYEDVEYNRKEFDDKETYAEVNDSIHTAESNPYDQPSHNPCPSSSTGYKQPRPQQTGRKTTQAASIKNCDVIYSNTKQHNTNDQVSSQNEHVYMGLLKNNCQGHEPNKMEEKKM